MIMRNIFILCLFLTISTNAQNRFEPEELVNVMMGTDSKLSFSNGNTYPAIAVPWGMNFWSPQTGPNGNGWQYQYASERIRGFKQTHQPSPWIGDYGQFSIMPMTGKARLNEEQRGSFFSHKAELAKPYYYSVFLADDNLQTEIAPTERASLFRITYPKSDSSFILVDAFDRGSYVKIIPAENKIVGYTTRNRGGVPTNFRNYFVIQCSKAFQLFFTVNDQLIRSTEKEFTGNHAQALIAFATQSGEQVELKVSSSFISPEQAQLNLDREVGAKHFDQVVQEAKKAWNKELSKVKAEGGTEEQLKTFYSCLYRMLLFPRKFYEINKENQIVHYSPYNGKVESGYMFTDTGFWDTFRSLFPFLALVFPEVDSHIMEGLANTYKESGWLPEWASPGHKKSMVGNNSASVIADAYMKGIRGFDINLLYEAMLKGSNGEGSIPTIGRNGAEAYNRLGYVPVDQFGGSAAKTLEYAYADYCISQVAKSLKRPQAEIDLYQKRALNYSNIFDPAHNLMRGKKADGSFETGFNPFRWGFEFVEGNSWHYSWSVFQDFNGLAKLMGGPKELERMLDSVFVLPPIFDTAYYKRTIHEMVEMQVMNMGQYAHGNQPIQHMLYIYNYCGAPWKSQQHVRYAMNKLYKPTPDGYCGDEDNGQTSAWYVFSAMGFYPVCPGSNEYVLGSPLFKKITLDLGKGNKFAIESPNNTPSNLYIESALLNGSPYNKNFINHFDIQKGGVLKFNMSSLPNKKRGVSQDAFPFSISKPTVK
jgi:predicted alpha-1,2-mannosidase